MRTPEERNRQATAIFALVLFLLLPFAYGGSYVVLRLTHRLVNYGGFISGRNAMGGPGGGISLLALAYTPCIAVESHVRRF